MAEFVVVVPLLLLILVATIGFGHTLFAKMVVVQAANRAARVGAVLYGDSATSRSEAYRRTHDAAVSMLGAGLRGNDRDIIIRTVGADIHVTVRYRSSVFVPFLRPWLGDRMEIAHQSIYRIERDTH